MKLTEWAKGRPPMIGEWSVKFIELATESNDTSMRAWWNGECWSALYFDNESEEKKRACRRFANIFLTAGVGSIQYRGLVEKPDYPFPPEPLE